MSVRISNSKGYFVYCDVDDNPSNYCNIYGCAEECLNDIREDIITFCEVNEYSVNDTHDVISHYEIKFNNYSGGWKDTF